MKILELKKETISNLNMAEILGGKRPTESDEGCAGSANCAPTLDYTCTGCTFQNCPSRNIHC